MRQLFLKLSLCIAAIAGVSCTLPAAEPIKALLVTGGCCHDYENQKRIISEGISQRANVEWTILHVGGDSRDFEVPIYREEDWADDFDVVVHNECFGAVTDPEFVKAITGAHFAGVPAVFIHCSLHSYRGSPAADSWRELIGVTSTSHESHHNFTVVPTKAAEDHPVMIGFPTEWETPQGELYKIEKVWNNCLPLATAYGTDTQKDHPVIWVNTFGGTRVFGTSIGHHNETMNTNVWLDLVSRGVLWSVDKLEEDGQPSEGYAGTGIKPIVIGRPEPIPD